MPATARSDDSQHLPASRGDHDLLDCGHDLGQVMTGRRSKQKGKVGEREAAAELARLGFANARRGWADGYDLMPDSIPGVHIEVKRVERLNIQEAMVQALETAVRLHAGQPSPRLVPAVLHRRNRGSWMVTIRLEDLHLFSECVCDEQDRVRATKAMEVRNGDEA